MALVGDWTHIQGVSEYILKKVCKDFFLVSSGTTDMTLGLSGRFQSLGLPNQSTRLTGSTATGFSNVSLMCLDRVPSMEAYKLLNISPRWVLLNVTTKFDATTAKECFYRVQNKTISVFFPIYLDSSTLSFLPRFISYLN